MNTPRVPRISNILAALLLAGWFAVPALAQEQAPQQSDSVFGAIGRWFNDSFSTVGTRFQNAREGVDTFNREAGAAARVTGGAVKDAASAVAKLPNTRILSGHQKCLISTNGAPDCGDAANKLCKAKGFSFGQSLDVTAAEECPVRVALGQREAKPGECRIVTFVSKAVCQ